MVWIRPRPLAALRVLLLIALALVPLALGAHVHALSDPGTPDSCAICVVQHRSPAASAAMVPSPVPVLHAVPVVLLFWAAPTAVFRPLQTGRAPPLLSILA